MAAIAGIYPPVPTFFDAEEELDLQTLRNHIVRLREHGIANFVALGSNGEAVHLDAAERRQVIATIREAAGSQAQVLAGTGAPACVLSLANDRPCPAGAFPSRSRCEPVARSALQYAGQQRRCRSGRGN